MEDDYTWDLLKKKIEKMNEEINHDLLCILCKKLMKNPALSPCGHYFCIECITDGMSCPEDGDTFTDFRPFIAKPLKKKLLKLNISCLYDNNCNWEGNLENFEYHYFKCEFQPINCENGCLQKIIKTNYHFHLLNCPEGLEECKFCKNLVKNKNIDDHLEVCPKIIIKCPNKCDEELTFNREILNTHLQICPNSNLFCNIHNVEIQRQNFNDHFTDNLSDHFLRLDSENKKLTDEIRILETKLIDKEDKISHLYCLIEKLNKDVTTLFSENKTINGLLENEAKTNEDLMQSLINHKKEISIKHDSLNEKFLTKSIFYKEREYLTWMIFAIFCILVIYNCISSGKIKNNILRVENDNGNLKVQLVDLIYSIIPKAQGLKWVMSGHDDPNINYENLNTWSIYNRRAFSKTFIEADFGIKVKVSKISMGSEESLNGNIIEFSLDCKNFEQYTKIERVERENKIEFNLDKIVGQCWRITKGSGSDLN